MKYLIHCVENVNSLILCKLITLISMEKLKLGYNLSQFIHRFDIAIFECWSQAKFRIFPNSKKRYFGIFECFGIFDCEDSLSGMVTL